MDTRTRLSLAVLPLMVGLAACGGGGGGGGTSATLGGFTSWSAVQSPSTTTVTGIGQQVSYTTDAGGYVNGVPSPSSVGAASFTQVLNSSGLATRASITTSTGDTISFDVARGDQFFTEGPINLAISADTTKLAISAYPDALGWDYQSFGAWITGYGLSAGKSGVVSVGAVTPTNSVPTSGSAQYVGGFGGIYVTGDGYGYVAIGDLTADVDFGSRSVQLAGTGAIATDLNTGADIVAPNLNFNGSASYAAGSSRFEGTLTTAGGLTGATTGQFYGPQAQELGGVATLTSGTSVETFGVAYGAKR